MYITSIRDTVIDSLLTIKTDQKNAHLPTIKYEKLPQKIDLDLIETSSFRMN